MTKCFKNLKKVCRLETASFFSLFFCGKSSRNSSNFFKCFLSPKSWPFGSRNSRTPPTNIISEVLQEGSILPTGICNS